MAQTFEKGQTVMVLQRREYGRLGNHNLLETWERAVVIDPDAFENTCGFKKDGTQKRRAMVEVEFTVVSIGPDGAAAQTYTRRVANATNVIRTVEGYEEIQERNASIKAARKASRRASDEEARADRMFVAGRIIQVLEDAVSYKYSHIQALANFFEGEGCDILNSYFVRRLRASNAGLMALKGGTSDEPFLLEAPDDDAEEGESQ